MPFKSFRHIQKRFDTWNTKQEDDGPGYYPFAIWYFVKGLTLWLNDQEDQVNEEGGRSMKKIATFEELKEKIQDKLRLYGYTNVDEIPEGVEIVCERCRW